MTDPEKALPDPAQLVSDLRQLADRIEQDPTRDGLALTEAKFSMGRKTGDRIFLRRKIVSSTLTLTLVWGEGREAPISDWINKGDSDHE